MESEANKTKTNDKQELRYRMVEHYQEYVLLNGKEPPSIFSFCKDLGINEAEFYDHFNDFSQVAGAFWTKSFSSIKKMLTEDTEFGSFSVREKYLSFYYAFFEEIKKNRSYALLSFKESSNLLKREARHLMELKKDFKAWSKELIAEGMSNEEIASRTKISDAYDNLFWMQFIFLINFWIKDGSKAFEKTDIAIEKSVHFGFDLIERNALDSAFDFGKFLFQNR
jgi:hypothetical protein